MTKAPTRSLAALLAALSLLPLASPGQDASDQFVELLRAAREEAEWPGLSVKEAAANLGGAEAALQFVREGVASVDYTGSLQGAAGALRTRTANNLDKAVLLEAILRELGYATEIMSGPRGTKQQAHRPAGLERPRPALAALRKFVAAATADRAGELPPLSNESLLDAERAAIEALDREVAAALAVLRPELDAQGWTMKKAAPVNRRSATWFWVRARKGEQIWKTFDVYSEKVHLPAHPVRHTPESSTVTIAIDLVDPAGTTKRVFEWLAPSHEIAGRELLLGWSPVDDRYLSAEDVILPLDIEVAQWVPIFRAGPHRIKGLPFALPTGARSSGASIRLALDLQHQGKTERLGRVLQDLGPGFDQHEMLAIHRIGITAAGIPVSVVQARLLDEILDVSLMRGFARDGRAPRELSAQRGITTRTARVANKMITTAHHLDPEGRHLTWQGPAIFIETTRLQHAEGKTTSLTMLDVLQHSMAPASHAPLDLKLRWGLAVCAAEAQLVEGISVNRLLLDAEGSFQRIAVDSQARGLVARALEGGATVLTRPKAGQAAWAVMPDGNLLGIVSARPLLQAKGGMSRRQPAPVAAGAFGALGSAALAAGGGVAAGPMVGGIAGYLNELRKALEGITGKMIRIGNAIATGNTSGLNDGDEYLRNLAGNLMGGFGQGYATGYVSGAVSAGLGGLINPGPAAGAGISIGVDLGATAATMDASELRGAFFMASEGP